MKNIPEKNPVEWGGLPDMQGAWIILQPIQADMQLAVSGHLVSGTYCCANVKGAIEGTLIKEGNDNILIGKWSDQLGKGDFSVSIGDAIDNREGADVSRTIFQGNWKHSRSQSWDGVFMAEKR